jgi:hypothetical protein
MPRTFAYARRGGHMLLAHGPNPPGDAEWAEYLRDLARWLPDSVGLLIVTTGGGPTSSQRRALREVAAAVPTATTPTAVVSSSRLVRGIVIAISLFAPSIRVFAPEALADALAYVKVHPADQAEMLAQLEQLQRTLA